MTDVIERLVRRERTGEIPMLELESSEKGPTVWKKKTGGKFWIIDGSTLLEDGEITIDLSVFDVEMEAGENKMVLKYKDA